MKKIIGTFLVLLVLIFTFATTVSASDVGSSDDSRSVAELFVDAEIVKQLGVVTTETGTVDQFQMLITSGEFKGQTIVVEHWLTGNTSMDIVAAVGDKVILRYTLDDNGQIEEVSISDFQRNNSLIILVFIFILIMIIIGGLKGLKALVSLSITVGSILFILIPAILAGYDPATVAVIVSGVITFLTFAIINGFNKKTYVAFLGTFIGVLSSGFLAYLFSNLAHLRGLSSDENAMLTFLPNVTLNFGSLLFASILIGSLGAVMDIAMSLSSTMEELKAQNPAITRSSMRKSAFNVGRDMMGTMANTLILAYVGGSLSLLLLFSAYDLELGYITNLEVIATEIVRSLTGSIGLILSIPVTIFLGIRLYIGRKEKTGEIKTD